MKAEAKSKGAVLNNSSTLAVNARKKQMSLMLFFKPAKKEEILKEQKTETFSKETVNNGKAEEDARSDSEKENDTSIMDAPGDAPSPLTLEQDVLQGIAVKNTQLPNSSPVRKQEIEDREAFHGIKRESVLEPADIASTEKRARADGLKLRGLRTRKSQPVSYADSDSDEEGESVSGARKRRRIVESDDDLDEFMPQDENAESEDDMSDFVVDEEDVESQSEPEEESDYENTKKTKKASGTGKPARSSSSSSSPNVSEKPNSAKKTPNKDLAEKFTANSSYSVDLKPEVPRKPVSTATSKKSFTKENEERYQWLVNIKDAQKRSVGDPEYDSRTLYIPQSAWSSFTAFEKQYWEIKSKMWDTVVFFKKGKFYELYENDAEIANSEFDLKLAGGGRANMKLAGIPEMSFEYWAKEFIDHGYKVAKVDQKETLLAKEMRGGSTKEEKIIKRELTGILTGGTLTDLNMINDDMSVYCLSIREEVLDNGCKLFGIAFVDTATSEMNLVEFEDDQECTKLDTLITQVKPKEIICEKNNLCSIATKILKFSSHSTNQIWNNLNPISEFWDYDTTLEKLIKGSYYEAEDLDDFSQYPSTLVQYKDEKKCAFHAFGGLLFYLKSLKLDLSILSLGNIKEYVISKNTTTHLILDGVSLSNLEVLNNSFDGTDKGTLFKLINRAITPFGKRMLKMWLLHPLMDIKKINERYDSIDFFMNGGIELREMLEKTLNSLPDLERLLARIHGKTLKFKDFLRVVESYESIAKLTSSIKDYDFTNTGALHSYIANIPKELETCISHWEDAFDRAEALSDNIVPMKGVDSEFDNSSEVLGSLEAQLEEHLRTYRKEFKSNEICYKDSGKEVYLIEVPNKIKNIPNDWQQMGSTSKVKRYWSPEVRKLVRELLEQRELHKMVCETLKFRMYEKFEKDYSTYMRTLQILARIDCLIALTKTSESIGFPSCRPTFIESDKGQVEFKELRHPCFTGTKDFIPNDVVLGGSKPNIGLLTGANAAGKSTIMRTTALAIILSQIGCYVPASFAALTPVDRIMTRLGANDNIMQGKSTFFVELSETKRILSTTTPKSFVILDELGRGGSSSDGFSIAEAVLHHIATHIQSLGFFATHFGSLGLLFRNHPQIRPMRMGILVDENTRNITFLYKLEEGTAPGSFGMNVAAMCGIAEEIVSNAERTAEEYEKQSRIKRHSTLQAQNSYELSLGLQSDFVWFACEEKDLSKDVFLYDKATKEGALQNVFSMIDKL